MHSTGVCSRAARNLRAPPPNTRYAWNYDAEGWPSNSVDGSSHLLPCYARQPNTTAPQLGALRNLAIAVTTASIPGHTTDYNLTTTIVALPSGMFNGVGSDSGASPYGVGTDSGFRQVASVDGISGFWISGIAASNYGYRYLGWGMSSSVLVCGEGVLEARGSAYIEPGTDSARGIVIGPDGQLYGASNYHLEHTFGGLYGIGSGLQTTLTHTVSRIWGISNTNPKATTHIAYVPFTFVIESAASIWVSQDLGNGLPASIVQYTQAQGSTAIIRHGKWASHKVVTVPFEHDPLYSLTGRYEMNAGGFVVYAASPSTAYRLAPGAMAVAVVSRRAAPCSDGSHSECFHGVAFPPMPPGAPACPTEHFTPLPTSTCACPTLLPY